MKTRIFWSDAEVNLVADRVIGMQDAATAEGGKQPSLISLCKLAQVEVLPKKRQRNLLVAPPAVLESIEAKRIEMSSRESASAPPVRRRRRMAAIKTETQVSQSLTDFSDKQLTEELGRRLVRRAVRRFVLDNK
jgi:hypothetical protein